RAGLRSRCAGAGRRRACRPAWAPRRLRRRWKRPGTRERGHALASRGVENTAALLAEAVLRAGPVARAVDREAAGAGGGHEEVDEGVEERELAAVLDRPEALRQVRDDVGGEHLDDEHQRDRAGEQAEHDQEAAERLEDAGEAEQGE